MGDLPLPRQDVRFVQRDSVDQQRSACRLEQAHDEVHQSRLAAPARTDDADARSARNDHAHLVQRQRQIGRVLERDVVQLDHAAQRPHFLGLTGEPRRDRLLEHVDDADQHSAVADQIGPPVVQLLEQRQQALGAEGESTDHRQRLADPAWFSRRDQDDRHQEKHARRLGDEPRRHCIKGIRALGIAQRIVDPREFPQIDALRIVEQDVANAADALLNRLDSGLVALGDDDGVLPQPWPDDQRYQHVDGAECEQGQKRYPGADDEQAGNDEHADDQRRQRLHHRKEGLPQQALNVLQVGDDPAAVDLDVEVVRLVQHPFVKSDADIVADPEHIFLAEPRQHDAYGRGDHRDCAEDGCGGRQRVGAGLNSDLVEQHADAGIAGGAGGLGEHREQGDYRADRHQLGETAQNHEKSDEDGLCSAAPGEDVAPDPAQGLPDHQVFRIPHRDSNATQPLQHRSLAI